MARRAAFIYEEGLAEHELSQNHPMKPVRLAYTHELLDAYGAFDAPNALLERPRRASEAEVLTYHSPKYIEAVRALRDGDPTADARRFNFGPGDNPAYPGMYDAAMLSTGASLKAAELLVDGDAEVAFNISGGLHHAMPGYAYGFCVFNDPVVAIKHLLSQGMRAVYVDIDCHHGDGVQHAFYDTDEVLTVSFHESGAFLFPGTGFTQETGAGRGRGYSVNVPLYPYTSDDIYLWALDQVVPPLVESFRPDVLVTQLGIDSHYLDPITHLGLTVQGFEQAVRELAKIAPSRWLAMGGGGYDLQAVARAWTLAFGVMSEQSFAEQVPEAYGLRHDVQSLRDAEPELDQQVQKDARAFAEARQCARALAEARVNAPMR